MMTTSINPVQQIGRFGPEQCEAMSVEQARQWCRTLAESHYENFTVLSRLVPHRLRNDFAAVYAFCRWADDLGDEFGDAGRGAELLSWWRGQLDQCYAGVPEHPVFVALRPTIEQHDLPREPFDDLISAFEQDQTVTRYESWEQLLGYCRLSANPVGRLVLMLGGAPRTQELYQPSDAACTALQLTNHLQDVKRDLLERDRIYLPAELLPGGDFEQRLRRSALQGWAVDHDLLPQFRAVMKTCVQRTWKLYERGEELLPKLDSTLRPIVWLLISGGEHVLHMIEMWNYETVLHRPSLSKARRLALVAEGWLTARWGRDAAGGGDSR